MHRPGHGCRTGVRRTVPLPTGTKVEDVTASYTDGVLEVRVPIKSKDAPASVTIPVTRAE